MKELKNEIIQYIDQLDEYYLRVVLSFVKRILENR